MSQTLGNLKAYLRTPFEQEHLFASALLALMGLRWLMVLFLVLDVPHLEGHVPPWYFHTGGDQHAYYNLALALSRGRTASELISLGSSLTMVPPIWIFQSSCIPNCYRDIVAPLVILNGFILGGLSVVLVGLVGKEYTGDRRAGLLASGLWLLLPVFLYLAIGLHSEASLLRGSLLPKIMWLTGISDGLASFSILLGVWALGRALHQRSPRHFFLSGLGFGWAVMTRIQVAPVVGLLLAILLLARAWRGLLWVSAGGLIGYLPQAVLNMVEFGFPFYTSYLRNTTPGEGRGRPLIQVLKQLPYSPSALLGSVKYYVDQFPWLVPLLLLAAAMCMGAFLLLWREQGLPKAMILLGVPAIHILANAAVYIFPGDPVRHSMLAYPYLLVVGAYLPLRVWDARPWRVGRVDSRTESPRPTLARDNR